MKCASYKKIGLIGFAALGITMLMQACGGFLAATSSGSKQEVLRTKVFFQTQSVAEDDAHGTILAAGGGNGTVTYLADCLANGNCEAGDRHYIIIPPRTFEQKVMHYCTDDWAALAGGSVKTSTSLRIGFVNANNQLVCEINSTKARDTALNERVLREEISLAACPSFVSGRYTIMVTPGDKAIDLNPAKPLFHRSLLLGSGHHSANNPYQADITVDGLGNIDIKPAIAGDIPSLLAKGYAGPGECDRASPLVVQLTPTPRKVRLTSPSNGVRFNILGQNDSPVNQLRQISWFSHGDAVSHYYITLPDSAGRVNGIDQLFGDNTKGPDGQFASNGYEALRKWDGRRPDGTYDSKARDGKIDQNDFIYNQLRFWSDRNANGQAETVELFRLEELAIKSIDLDYDPNYSETDRWGNKIMMKSVVEAFDGTFYLMYDIWYSLID